MRSLLFAVIVVLAAPLAAYADDAKIAVNIQLELMRLRATSNAAIAHGRWATVGKTLTDFTIEGRRASACANGSCAPQATSSRGSCSSSATRTRLFRGGLFRRGCGG